MRFMIKNKPLKRGLSRWVSFTISFILATTQSSLAINSAKTNTDTKADQLLATVTDAYQKAYGSAPGSIRVDQKNINGVTTYYVAVSRCESGNSNCHQIYQHTFRESVGFVQVDGHFYSAVGTDVYSGDTKPMMSPQQSAAGDFSEGDRSTPQRLDYRAGTGEYNAETNTLNLQAMYRPEPQTLNSMGLGRFLPAVHQALESSTQNLENSLRTSQVMHESYQRSLEGLGGVADLFQRQALNVAKDTAQFEAVSALTLANVGATLMAKTESPEQAKALAELQRAKNDPLVFKQYDLTELAQVELERSLAQALKNKNVRQVADVARIGSNQRDPQALKRFAEQSKNFIHDGVVVVATINAQAGSSPLDHRKLDLAASTPAGQAIRQTANLAQSYWSEQNGFSSATVNHKALFVSGLSVLSAAENQFQRGANSEAYSSLGLATQLFHASVGFVGGFAKAAESFISSIPALGHAALGLSQALYEDPERVCQSAAEFIRQTPKMARLIGAAAERMGRKFVNGDARYRGEVIGRLSGEVLIAVASGGVLRTATKIVQGAELIGQGERAAQALGGLLHATPELGEALAESSRAMELEAGALALTRQELFSEVRLAGLKADKVIPGKTSKVIVLGRSMGTAENPGVLQYSSELATQGFDVETFSPSAQAQIEFRELSQRAGRYLEKSELQSTKIYQENAKWLEGHVSDVDKRATVIDLGNPRGLPESHFYNLEQDILRRVYGL